MSYQVIISLNHQSVLRIIFTEFCIKVLQGFIGVLSLAVRNWMGNSPETTENDIFFWPVGVGCRRKVLRAAPKNVPITPEDFFFVVGDGAVSRSYGSDLTHLFFEPGDSMGPARSRRCGDSSSHRIHPVRGPDAGRASVRPHHHRLYVLHHISAAVWLGKWRHLTFY